MATVGINGKMLGGQPSEEISSTFGSVVFTNLDEASSPAAIARDQRQAVLEAHRGGCTTAEKISKCLWLEIWVVRRRMHELGLGPAPDLKMVRGTSVKDELAPKIAECLRAGPKVSAEIAMMLGAKVATCLSVLRSCSDRFVSESLGRGKGARLIWSLRIEPATTNATG